MGQEGNYENVLNKLMKQSELQRGREKTREAGSAEIGQSTIFEGEREERQKQGSCLGNMGMVVGNSKLTGTWCIFNMR